MISQKMKWFLWVEFNTSPTCPLLLEHFPICKLIFIDQSFALLITNPFILFKRTLQNYAKWQLINSKLKMFATITNGLSNSSNDLYCLATVKQLMPAAVGRVFAEYVLPSGTKVSYFYILHFYYFILSLT